MVKGGKDNRSFRKIRRCKKKFAGNRYTVNSDENIVKKVLEEILVAVVEDELKQF